jgi:low affinity Fe/Cu permease
MKEAFRRFAESAAHAVGSHWAFLIAAATILIWGATGYLFNYSDTWQLLINTGTTIVTFLMVFLIQNTQNRDSRIVALKLDELLCAVRGARSSLVGLDQMSDEDLERVQAQFEQMRHRYSPLVDDDLEHVGRELDKRRKAKRPKAAE